MEENLLMTVEAMEKPETKTEPKGGKPPPKKPTRNGSMETRR